jgi:hypothetical protein
VAELVLLTVAQTVVLLRAGAPVPSDKRYALHLRAPSRMRHE